MDSWNSAGVVVVSWFVGGHTDNLAGKAEQ